jgi:hypothetical protein
MSGSFFRHRLIRWILCALAVTATGVAGNRDKYLAAAGPTPLRFQREVPQFNPAWLLPELDMGDEKPAQTTKSAEATETAPPANTNTGAAADQQVQPETQNTIPEEIVLPATQPLANSEPIQKQSSTGPLSSQALLRFFTRNGTNEVLVPYDIEFTPPVPGRTTGSSAVYVSE